MRTILCICITAVMVALTNGECNACATSTNTACVSDTQFQFCVNNFPTGPVNSCPFGYVCAADTVICQQNTSSKSCVGCNKCNDDLIFACTGPRTFALCLGTNVISEITGSCAPFHVCNMNLPAICGNTTEGVTATCSFLDDTITTTQATSTVNNATEYCRTIKRGGRFPNGIALSTTCRQYINCYKLSGLWYGALYTCPGSTYFDSGSRMCTLDIPARCSTGVQTLQLNSLVLN